MSKTDKHKIKSQLDINESKIFENQRATMYAALGLIQYETHKVSNKWNSIIINQKSIYDEQLHDK